ncbi:hypothetical protein [Jutongia sp.]
MIDYGKTRSAVRPDDVEITETKVFVASNIKNFSETMDGQEIKGFEFNLVEYEKDEYIKKMHDDNDNLAQQMTETQVALCDVYELLG